MFDVNAKNRTAADIDATVVKEIEEAQREAIETAKIIYKLRQRVSKALKHGTMTKTEARELEQKNIQLKEQINIFEEKSKRIQFLIDQASLFENLITPRPPLPEKHKEDILPKVVICGLTEHNIPKIIACDEKKKSKKPPCTCGLPPPSATVVPHFLKKLTESYRKQEKFSAEDSNLEDKRYKLQEDLLEKDRMADSLQRKLQKLQADLCILSKENCLLSENLNPEPSSSQQEIRPSCGKNKGPCVADIESRLQEYSDITQKLEEEVRQMESDARNIMQSKVVVGQKEQPTTTPATCTPPPGHPCMPPPCKMRVDKSGKRR